MQAHETLGVAPDATAEEVTRAYRRLARALHPDAHPGATPEKRAQAEAAMALVNGAYREITVRSKPRQSARGQAERGGVATPGDGRDSRPRGCSICGHGPAASLSFEYQEGFLFSRRRISQRSRLCRDCGRAVGRSHQERTLRRGFWGPTLFVSNVGVVVRNARTLRRAESLARPARVPGAAGPLDEPMSPGSPMVCRAGFWVLPVIIGLVACIWAGVGVGDPGAAATERHLSPGSCLVGLHTVTAVPCTEAHDAVIVARADLPSKCPDVAQAYLEDGMKRVLCVHSLS